MCLKISLATSVFSLSLYGVFIPDLQITVTLFVSYPKPAPSSFNEFRTIKSKFFFFSLFFAFESSSLFSRAKPTKI